jgi:hypothetical protein
MTKNIPRPFCYGLVCSILCGVHILLFIFNDVNILYVAAIFGGSSYGAMNAMNPIVCSELYGTKNLVTPSHLHGQHAMATLTKSTRVIVTQGATYATVSISLAFGSYIFAKQMAGGALPTRFSREMRCC